MLVPRNCANFLNSALVQRCCASACARCQFMVACRRVAQSKPGSSGTFLSASPENRWRLTVIEVIGTLTRSM